MILVSPSLSSWPLACESQGGGDAACTRRVMDSSPPPNLGNLIIFFGILLSIGIFMGFGVSQNMWGGIEFVSEGSLFALVILFFSILTGILFRGQSFIQQPATSYDLSSQEKKWVDEALNDNGQDHTLPSQDSCLHLLDQ